jgi:hypothetical protein
MIERLVKREICYGKEMNFEKVREGKSNLENMKYFDYTGNLKTCKMYT